MDFQEMTTHPWIYGPVASIATVLLLLLVKRWLFRLVTRLAERTSTRMDDLFLQAAGRALTLLILASGLFLLGQLLELPPKAVDLRIDRGLISRNLPFVKKKAVEILKAAGKLPSRSAAAARIVADLTDFYRTQYPDVYRIWGRRRAAAAVRDIYLRNVFPR
jgi:hypothetical protein